MSYLLIDIGNSFVKYATYEANTLSPVKIVSSALFKQDVSLIELSQSAPLQGILYVSVADVAYTKKISTELESHFQCSTQRIQTQETNFGVTCGYFEPALLGDDRWLAILAAFSSVAAKTLKHNEKASALMIVDCGSVVTVDVIHSSGQHLGGWMMPNSELMASSLGQKSAAIKQGLQLNKDVSAAEQTSLKTAVAYGCSTRDCIEQGSQLAVVGFIEQCFAKVKADKAVMPICFLTGGGAEQIISLLSIGVEYRPNLVFDGLTLFVE